MYDIDMRHCLSEVDLEKRSGICSIDGSVRLHVHGTKRQCYYAHIYGSKNVALRPKPLNCEICGEENKLCFDHSHANKKHRGWLCKSCNLMLGYARDSKQILQAAIDYL